jgi:hypothetical protein
MAIIDLNFLFHLNGQKILSDESSQVLQFLLRISGLFIF